MTSKSEIRERHRMLRKSLKNEDREILSEKITERFLEFLDKRKEIQHVHIFLPIERLLEVNTYALLKKLFERKINVYTSLVSKDKITLDTVALHRESVFAIDKWGIPIPENAEKISSDEIQLVVIPLLAFDLKGHRLGYGKGFYDRFLESLKQPVFKVGFSYFDPVESIPHENHDIALDICITPGKILSF
ncbi:5-formyltetrahydrofolate cyclo-ligase [Rhodonellum sp.]|uniref:5-formyltetrahydrofolate cyclo-ligase n=1 Tax=Rhodonellum sp. TaxID=2231180 RepID=UPI002726DCAF|nr:5-formyltetrahydrofolate cyclo-ligase [Rhodonellum sp.]MDO9553693.1 5-formyltetrahydrofolate cyclo-ligase [Rhodonellum sp.]